MLFIFRMLNMLNIPRVDLHLPILHMLQNLCIIFILNNFYVLETFWVLLVSVATPGFQHLAFRCLSQSRTSPNIGSERKMSKSCPLELGPLSVSEASISIRRKALRAVKLRPVASITFCLAPSAWRCKDGASWEGLGCVGGAVAAACKH